MALSTQPYKGARDFYPEDKRLQKYIFDVWRSIAEKFGYEEYDAPLIEPLELYTAKTGEEIVNEQTYMFEDRGGRQVVIRPEMTPTVSRMVAARRQELAYPLRWYSIPNLWRYERPQRGRLREHWQLNVDVFGQEGLAAEHEMIEMADAIMQAFGAKRDTYTIRLNSRKLVDAVLSKHLGSETQTIHDTVKLLDRKAKLTEEEFQQQLAEIVPNDKTEALLQILSVKSFNELPAEFKDHPSVAELLKLKSLLEESGIDNVQDDISLMRGFDYYTDIVFEVFDNHPDNNRSMFGGGRYDGLVGLFGVEPVPTVGFGMGDVTLANFLEGHELLPELKTETDLYAILIGDVYAAAQKPLAELRQMGVNVAADYTGRKLDKQIKTADKKGIRYALFIGEKELESEQFVLKDLKTGQEERHGLQRIVTSIKDYRSRNIGD